MAASCFFLHPSGYLLPLHLLLKNHQVFPTSVCIYLLVVPVMTLALKQAAWRVAPAYTSLHTRETIS